MALLHNKKKVTMDEALSVATTRIADDIGGLMVRKESALSSFRNTVVALDAVNDELQNSLTKLGNLTTFIEEHRQAAEQAMADNTMVRQKIIEIIGEA